MTNSTLGEAWTEVAQRTTDYVYEEQQSGFRSASQLSMVVLAKTEDGADEGGQAT